MRSWYVVQTKPRMEADAARNLERQGFDTYLPRYIRRRRHARRIDTVRVPLFPAYLFVAFDVDADRWLAIRSTTGVRHLLSRGDLPLVVPPTILQEIKGREGADGLVLVDYSRMFQRGESIRVTAGPFQDCLGLFEARSDRERVFVLMTLLGRSVQIAVPTVAIERAA